MMTPDGARQVASCEFMCAVCSALATRLTLFDHVGGINFVERQRAFEPGPRKAYLVLEGFIGSTEIAIGLDALPALEGFITQKDAAAIHAMNSDYAACFCRECAVPYCSKHWIKMVDYDEGFYDCTRGTCPRGHSQILDD